MRALLRIAPLYERLDRFIYDTQSRRPQGAQADSFRRKQAVDAGIVSIFEFVLARDHGRKTISGARCQCEVIFGEALLQSLFPSDIPLFVVVQIGKCRERKNPTEVLVASFDLPSP